MSRKDTRSKICPVCERPFTWRKKWAKNWEHVVYCSKACRSGKYARARASQTSNKAVRNASI